MSKRNGRCSCGSGKKYKDCHGNQPPVSPTPSARSVSPPPPGVGIKQTQDDLVEHLREAVGFLKDSSAAFDQGKRGEAKRLAVTIRVLVHDTDTSHSLLGQLGRKDKILYYSSPNPYGPSNVMTENRLVMQRATFAPIPAGGGVEFMAFLDNFPPVFPWRRLGFSDWWSESVIRDVNKVTTGRRQLVLGVADKDGGAHVDPALDARYALLSRGNPMGIVFHDGVDQSEPKDMHLASVRQVAHELEKTLREELAELLKE